MNNKKIYCQTVAQLSEEEFEKIPINELQEMIGWIEPDDNGKWDITMCEGHFECDSQETAQIISSLEENKAMLMNMAHKITSMQGMKE